MNNHVRVMIGSDHKVIYAVLIGIEGIPHLWGEFLHTIGWENLTNEKKNSKLN